MTQFVLISNCGTCGKDLRANSETLVHYFTDSELLGCRELLTWPEMLSPLWDNEHLQCDVCLLPSSGISVERYLPSSILFVEFGTVAQRLFSFNSTISVYGHSYDLRGLVRHQSRHFTCAVMRDRDNCWTYFDDLSLNVKRYHTAENLIQAKGIGWFFGIYVLSSILRTVNPVNSLRRAKYTMKKDELNLKRRLKYAERKRKSKCIPVSNTNGNVDVLPDSKVKRNTSCKKNERINAIRRERYASKKRKVFETRAKMILQRTYLSLRKYLWIKKLF